MCNWRVARSQEHFLERASKEASKCILMCSEQEKVDPLWSTVKNKLTATEALCFLGKVDVSASTGGGCKR